MKQDKETIKSYFQTGDKPTQEQYYDTWDSFWHKDDVLPSSGENTGSAPSVINTDGNLTYVNNPIGGQHSIGTAIRTGYLVIKTPHTVGNNYVHYNFTLEIGSQYESPMQMHISAQWLTAGFSKLYAYSISQETRNYTIRAGSDGTYIYFLIGEADTSWNRSYVKLKDISIAYSYKDVDVFKTGWEIDFSSDVAGFTANKTQEYVDIFNQITGVIKTTENYQKNNWNTIALGSPNSCSATFLLKRLDQIEGSFTVSKSYGKRTLKVNYLTQYSQESIKGIRLTSNNEVQILLGNEYNTNIDITIVNSSGEFQLVNSLATGNETVVRSIDLNGTEFGEIHSNSIEALDGIVLKSDNNTKWKLSVDNAGALVTTSL